MSTIADHYALMIDALKKQSNFTRIEFWAFTTLFVFILFFFVTDSLDGRSALDDAPYRPQFEKANVPFSYYSNHFIPQFIRHIILFLSFMTLNFLIIPKLVKREALLQHILFFILIFIVAGVIFGITGTYLHAYLYAAGSRDQTDQAIYLDSFEYTFTLLTVLLIYSFIKYSGMFLILRSDAINARFKLITREVLLATFVWIVLLLFWVIGDADNELILGWTVIVPYAIFFYAYATNKIIPHCLPKKRPFISYLMRSILFITALFIPIMILMMIFIQSEDLIFDIIGFNSVFQGFITVPLTWVLYKRQAKGAEEVLVLKKELKQSTANIDFLRSQINPHFLFNALNTIYGTAIQEKAERTSEGIEKLGDMMRFMLQENMQEKISLCREIDYLNNYISLQKLRTDTNPIVRIETDIQSRETVFRIAPMLLIPFVENAFKHGISFREPSHIKVSLEIKNNTLYFDVYNSKHDRRDNDPEKDKSGIGLENVKQRLKLLYPNRHDLMIRENTREFFIHLTIQLT